MVRRPTGKYVFTFLKKSPFSCQCGLGSLMPNYPPSLTFIMIGFLLSEIHIQCLNMLPISMRKANNVTLIPYLM